MWSAGSKSSTWAATCERNGDGSKRSMRLTGDAFARRPARNAGSPVPIAEMTPSPVIQTSRGSFTSGTRSSVASASARARNVARVRPAIGRVNAVSTNRANPGTRGRKSCPISTLVAPGPAGSIVQVTSMPFVAPATWWKWSRRVAGSCQVRLRQATGMPRPSHGTMTRRATKSHTREPSASRRTTRDRA